MKKNNMFALCVLAAVAAILPLGAQSAAGSASGAAAAAQPPNPAALGSFLDLLMEKHYEEQVQTALGSFTFEYTDLPTPFTRWLQDELVQAAAAAKRLRLFNRAAALSMDPAFQKVYADFFDTNSVGALLAGKYFDEGKAVRVRFELTDLHTGNLIGAGEYCLDRTTFPGSVSVAPSESVKTAANSLAKVSGPGPASPAGSAALSSVASGIGASGAPASGGGELRLALTTDRGTGAAYRDGEALTILVSVDRDAYVKLYHIDVNGSVSLIWPNRFGGGQGLIRAGQGVRIPDSGAPFSFLLGAPYGTEFIKAVASTVPFAVREDDFNPLGTNAQGVISRGLTPAMNTPNAGAGQIGEALVSYMILQK